MEQQRRIINVNDCYHFYLILYYTLYYIRVEIVRLLSITIVYFIFMMEFLHFSFLSLSLSFSLLLIPHQGNQDLLLAFVILSRDFKGTSRVLLA